MAAGVRGDMISLAAGLVDNSTLPVEEASRLLRELLADVPAAQAALQYGTTEGLPALRQALLEHLASLDGLDVQDLQATPDNLIVATGSQQLLYILTDILVDPGDIVITAWPSYFVYAGVLRALGAQARCVDLDQAGMIVESLEDVLGQLERSGDLHRVKILYVISYHQNPTGLTLEASRRPRILEVIRRFSRTHRILVIEDAAYRELTFEGPIPPSIKKFDTRNEYVALLQTFSKSFSPGLKTGYALLPDDLVDPVVKQKGNHDFGSSSFCQHLLLAAIRSGAYAGHLHKLRTTYSAKCAAMLEALQQHLGDFFPPQTRWSSPRGGLYVFLTLPPWMDTGINGPVMHQARAEGVLYVPGEYCYSPDPTRKIPGNTMRLSFGLASSPQIHEGIARLGRAIKKAASLAGRG